ncbi:MAG: ketoacyl-ACP synthase III [Treponema sp.]|jgi:3-oxoacyl-[acyl-carrier-protein] synthase-3|nr:ketoacyl-ACP synthase III [Treponema sp.]
MAIEIIGTGKYVPPRRVTNDELALERALDTSDEWIRSHTGIGARHIADDDMACSYLAIEASREALAMAEPGLSLEQAALTLDLIVLATVTGDYFGCPSTACIVQDKLGAKKAAAMDILAGCTGFIYAMETAAALLEASPDRKRALVIGSEVLCKFADWSDRGSCVLFGDGAGAAIIEKTAPSNGAGEKRGLLRTAIYADGSGAEVLFIKGGGSKELFKNGQTLEKSIHVVINGQAVYNFAVKVLVETVNELLAREGITMNDLALIIPHQANARIVQAAAKRLKVPEEKFYLNIEEYANTSAATIPIAMDELNRAGKLKRGDLIMTVGFGAGLTYGGNIIRW